MDNVYSVTQVNRYIKSLFDGSPALSRIMIRGEIANFKKYSSGHSYFTLKDENSQLGAVLFASDGASLKFKPCDGMRVIAEGSVSLYVKNGEYRLYVRKMQPDGLGALYLAYEQLKARLQSEGLFAVEHKKPLPAVPDAIGVITSPTGAAVRDIIDITGRRWPMARIFLYPSRVQGAEAEDDLLKGLGYFETGQKVDVIIIGRGGGSMEDLWVFNSEKLARKIFDMDTPVVSAVGHETDFTICDFVADKRAPTPSAAAEIVVPDRIEMGKRISSMSSLIAQKVAARFANKKKEIELAVQSIQNGIRSFLTGKGHEIRLRAEKLQALNPLAVLARGYSIAEKEGKAVTRAGQVKEGDELKLIFHKGSALSVIKKVEGDDVI